MGIRLPTWFRAVYNTITIVQNSAEIFFLFFVCAMVESPGRTLIIALALNREFRY